MKFKSKLGAFLLASSLLFSGALLGCNSNSGGGHKPEPPKPDYYLTVPSNEQYTISGIQDGDARKEGDLVSFSVTMTNPSDYALDNVMYNSSECDHEGNTYSFTMPADDVTIRVNYHEIEKYTLEVAPAPVVVGLVSTAQLKLGGSNYTGNYSIVEKEGEGVTGDVSISEHAITGVTAGTVKLQAVVGGVEVLEEPLTVTVRAAEKGETPELAFTASEAYQRIQDYGESKQESNIYVKGTISEITENDKQYDNVSFRIPCKNKAGEDKQLLFSRIGCVKTDARRDQIDVGSDVIVCSTLYRSGTTYRVQDGQLYSLENTNPVGLVASIQSVLVAPGEDVNPDVRIAPRGCSETAITFVSANTSVATVANDGTIHGVANGTTTVTASAEGFDSLTINVSVMTTEHAGTENDPYTVDEAIVVTKSLGTNGKLANKFVEGVVLDPITHHEGTFKNSTFYLIGSEQNFYCYRITTTDDQDNALVKGALAKVNVTLYYYNGTTPENDGGTLKTLDTTKVHLIETVDNSFQVSLQGEDYDLTGFAATYPEALEVAPQFASSDTDVFTIVEGKIHPVAAGTADLIVSAGEAENVRVAVEVVDGSAIDKWDVSGLVLPEGITKVVTLDEVEFPEVPEGTADKATIHGNTYYVICKISSLTDLTYGNGVLSNKNGTLSKDVRGLMSFDGNYRYDQLTNKPVEDSVVVLYCQANIYYRTASGSYSEKKTEQLGGWAQGEGPNGAKIMQIDGVVQTTPEVVGIKLSSDSINVKVGQDAAALSVSSTRVDAPLDPEVAILWAITEGGSYASVDGSTGVVTGVDVGTATLTATYGETGLTASATITVVSADTKVEQTITINKDSGWFTAVTTTSNIDQTVQGVRFQISASQISTDMVKVYKNQTLKIGGNNITLKSIELTCSASGTSDYGPGKFGAGAPTGYTYSGKVGTWTGNSDASVNFTATAGQVRITQLVITFEA